MEPFGLTALILAIISIPIPIIGYILAGISGILVFFSAKGKAGLGISAAMINMVNVFFLSPTLTVPIAMAEKHSTQFQGSRMLFFTLMLIQIAAIIFVVVKKRQQSRQEEQKSIE